MKNTILLSLILFGVASCNNESSAESLAQASIENLKLVTIAREQKDDAKVKQLEAAAKELHTKVSALNTEDQKLFEQELKKKMAELAKVSKK